MPGGLFGFGVLDNLLPPAAPAAPARRFTVGVIQAGGRATAGPGESALRAGLGHQVL